MQDKLDELQLRSEAVHEVLSEPPSWMIRWGITVIFTFLILILIASWIVKYPEFIPAQVQITTQYPPEKLEARTNGKLERILIRNQQTVRAGQVLANFETSANYQHILMLKSVLDTLKPNFEVFHFPINKLRTLQLGEIQPAFIQFEKSYLQYVLQQKLQPYKVETVAGQETLSEQSAQMQHLIIQRKLEQVKLNLAEQDYNRHQKLFNNGVISAVEFEQKKIALLQAQQALQSVDISLSSQANAISATKKNIHGSSISKQKDDTNFLVETLQSLDQLKKSLKDWEHMYLLTSSIDGKVSFQQYWGENQFVKSGEVVFVILPTSTKSLIGKLIVPAANTGKIKTGQRIIIKLDNYPYQQFGTVEGRIKNISLAPDKDGNYFIEAELPNNLETSQKKELEFDKELRGSAEIVTEDLRLLERFFYQFRNIFK
ncbi:HlyD family secretion protein [Pedobacter yonginense]|uniref:HlyD family secretion protein n=1 Tax=Pedobacter yonginense TaxID=651869 RepID=A0A317EK89_9SPHI|nr:HlyD family secretion protein [Pedobacter yonginense]PWS26509.1 HlyD family secretion protein [Pedobacter yonginense]